MTYGPLFERLMDSAWPVLYSHDKWILATDGACCAAVEGRCKDAQPAGEIMARVFSREPRRWKPARLAELREWAGPPPVRTVEPCPKWEAHEAHSQGDPDGADCEHGCWFVDGLGFAYEKMDRPFGTHWGNVGAMPFDLVRLAELLAPWPDRGAVFYGTRSDGALVVRADGWQIMLMRGHNVKAETKFKP